jgi:hypothetical protein
MTRRTRALLSLLLLSFAMTAVACADATAPAPNADTTCDQSNPNTCHH